MVRANSKAMARTKVRKKTRANVMTRAGGGAVKEAAARVRERQR